jgi:hypothetical protein
MKETTILPVGDYPSLDLSLSNPMFAHAKTGSSFGFRRQELTSIQESIDEQSPDEDDRKALQALKRTSVAPLDHGEEQPSKRRRTARRVVDSGELSP